MQSTPFPPRRAHSLPRGKNALFSLPPGEGWDAEVSDERYQGGTKAVHTSSCATVLYLLRWSKRRATSKFLLRAWVCDDFAQICSFSPTLASTCLSPDIVLHVLLCRSSLDDTDAQLRQVKQNARRVGVPIKSTDE